MPMASAVVIGRVMRQRRDTELDAVCHGAEVARGSNGVPADRHRPCHLPLERPKHRPEGGPRVPPFYSGCWRKKIFRGSRPLTSLQLVSKLTS